MAGRKKLDMTPEERIIYKREYQRMRRERIKNDDEKYAEYKRNNNEYMKSYWEKNNDKYVKYCISKN